MTDEKQNSIDGVLNIVGQIIVKYPRLVNENPPNSSIGGSFLIDRIGCIFFFVIKRIVNCAKLLNPLLTM